MAVCKKAEAVESVISRIKCVGMKALGLLLNHAADKTADDPAKFCDSPLD